MKFIPPVLVSMLGAAGLIPFVGLADKSLVGQLVRDEADAQLRRLAGKDHGFDRRQMQIGYGAVILSFLGGPHWGLAMCASSSALSAASAFRLIWGVTSSLIAWPALFVEDKKDSLNMLSGGLALAFAVDAVAWSAKLVPPYYMTLRLPLTIVAILSLQSNVQDKVDA